METIKSFTSIEQSRKLTEILPVESADMHWQYIEEDNGQLQWFCFPKDFSINQHDNICAWSLAALLEQLKSEIILENKQILFLHLNKYDDNSYEIRYTNSWTGEVLIAEADNLIDACVAMIEKLHELKVL